MVTDSDGEKLIKRDSDGRVEMKNERGEYVVQDLNVIRYPDLGITEQWKSKDTGIIVAQCIPCTH